MTLGSPLSTIRSRARARVSDLTSPLAHREPRLLWLAQVSSEIGDWAARLALAVLVLERTGSPAVTGLVTAATLLPWVGAGQLLATLADRWSRRSVMVAADLVRAAAFLLMLAPLPVPAVLVLAFLAGLATPPFEASRAAIAREVAGEEGYGRFLALAQVTFQTAIITGYLAGGGLVAAVGPRAALVVNAATFVFSAVLVARLREGGERHAPLTTRTRLRAAGGVILGDAFIRRAVLLTSAAMVSGMVVEALVAVFATRSLGASGAMAGVLATSIALGTVVTSVLIPSSGSHERLLRAAALVALGGGLAVLVLFALQPGLPVTLVAFAATGVIFGVALPTNVVVGTRLPAEVRASAFGLLQGSLMAGQAVGAGLGGWLASRAGVDAACAMAAVPVIAAATYSLLRPVGVGAKVLDLSEPARTLSLVDGAVEPATV